MVGAFYTTYNVGEEDFCAVCDLCATCGDAATRDLCAFLQTYVWRGS
ncbi:hypothetical protein GDO78_013951 [Eleutherodactylus coqui]|uniref:Uncharacterized protein n=1 Tax=Eleutherodactylus coqui TaxID=57060 RepID=A0A8J6E714_ELECQ|nr:hypothetical protein GDO78_013951 [Eleutherodactylus coqui]